MLVALFSAGCGTFIVDPESARPDAERATLTCFWRFYFVYIEECHVSAVDGQRPGVLQFSSLTTRLMPGRHWVEFGLESYFGGGGGTTDVCAFEHEFAAGHEYHLQAHSFEADVSWLQKHGNLLYSGSIAIEERGPGGETRTYRLPTSCSFGGGSLCRKTEDCNPHPDIVCQPQPGHPFGRCILGE